MWLTYGFDRSNAVVSTEQHMVPTCGSINQHGITTEQTFVLAYGFNLSNTVALIEQTYGFNRLAYGFNRAVLDNAVAVVGKAPSVQIIS